VPYARKRARGLPHSAAFAKVVALMQMDGNGYDFGSNWRSFIDHHLTDESRQEALQSLPAFLQRDSLEGLTFVDVGCGSGLFSWAALKLGAKRIVSFDVNPNSVACCKQLHADEGEPENWTVLEASILDEEAVRALGEFDVVYSWGVLHHTGRMWDAIENAAALVKPGGLMWIAIYNRADGIGLYSDGRVGSSRFWEREKIFYNRLSKVGQRAMDYAAASGMIAAYLLSGRNPVQEIRQHNQNRGMSWLVDIRDWLGGWPYEYASVEEIFSFVRKRFGYTLQNVISTNSLRNNEYLFRRPAE
jgi:2-polyprenyl-6-hydroxyphenyl methylase/3-demethylubiquinone-9 3-methyltransferase